MSKAINNLKTRTKSIPHYRVDKEKPTDIEEVKLKSKNIVDALVEAKLAASKSEAKRLLAQKGVKVDDKTASEETEIESGNLIQVGKRKFIKIK